MEVEQGPKSFEKLNKSDKWIIGYKERKGAVKFVINGCTRPKRFN